MTRKVSDELRIAYEQTNYKVFFQKKEIVLRVGKESLEMNQLLEELCLNNYAFLTAANPNSMLKSAEENKLRNIELENTLIDKKFTYCRGSGESIDEIWKEESFCIFGIDFKYAKALAIEFSQNAFLYGLKNKAPDIVWVQ